MLTRWDGRQTVEWWTGDGAFVGAAEVPLDGVTAGKDNIVAVARDGRAFALYTAPDEVRVIELVRQPDRIINGSSATPFASPLQRARRQQMCVRVDRLSRCRHGVVEGLVARDHEALIVAEIGELVGHHPGA